MKNLNSYRPTRAQLLTAGLALLAYLAGYITPAPAQVDQLAARPTSIVSTPTEKARATKTPITATLTPSATVTPVLWFH